MNYRNQLAVKGILNLVKEGKKNIVVFYGEAHTNVKDNKTFMGRIFRLINRIFKIKDIHELLEEKKVQSDIINQ